MVLMTDASKPEEPAEKPFGCPCESCKLERLDPTHKLKNAVIHRWNFKPREWRKKSIENDPHNYFLGVELETDNFTMVPLTPDEQVQEDSRWRYSWEGRTTTKRKVSRVANRVAADMRRPKQLWVAKSDGSVTGPEFASHPATLAYWHSKERELRSMFEMLLHAGYRSHDNDKAGMHINISRNAFANSNHLYRFLTLLHYSPAWSLRMSQRTAASMRQWAPLHGMESAGRRKKLCVKTFSPATWGAATEKYSALNMPPAIQGRFEFRLPRGTLRIDRFYKNLEWTVAMVEYTRTSKVSTSRPIPFMQYVAENKATYPHLAAFIVEREAKLTKATYRPRAAKQPVTPTVTTVPQPRDVVEALTPVRRYLIRDGVISLNPAYWGETS